MLQGGVPGANWQTRERFHITLRFIGEVDGHVAGDIDDVLSAITAPRFRLALKGVGEFGGRHPRALWAGVSNPEPVEHINRKIETALQRIGLPAEERKFTPHVTLAKLRASPHGRVVEWLTGHALFSSVEFDVRQFELYSSTLTPNGSIYVVERFYPLQ